MRARINDRMARAVQFPVTLVVAPAGFGKSVALRDFLESSRLETFRYDVRREDATVLALVHGLSQALAPIAPSAAATFPALQQRAMAAKNPVTEIAAWFDEHLKRTVCTLVIDDLHHASEDPHTVELIASLIDRTHDRIKWIITTRSDAGLPAATWLGYGRMDFLIGENDLRFTLDEARAAALSANADLDAKEVEALYELTNGWPVALAIALRTRTQASDLASAASGTRGMVYRFLAEQAYTGLAPGERRFLLDTSVFSTFDREIAEAFGGDAVFIENLRRRVAFINVLSESHLRYHDLFRDFLENELRRLGQGEWVAALARGAKILEERTEHAQALTLYSKAGEHAAVLGLIDRAGFALVERGEAEVVSTALDAIPEHLRAQSATALGIRAVLEANAGNFEFAERLFRSAISAADLNELRIMLTYRYALELVRIDRDCLELLEPYARSTEISPRLHLSILGTLATAYVRASRLKDAVLTIDRALEEAPADMGDDVRARLYQQAAYVRQFGPSLDSAQAYAERAVDLALSASLYDVAARAYSILYTIAYERSDDPIAILKILDKLGECARKGASSQATLFGLIAAYDLEVERGNDVAIEELDRRLEETRVLLPRARIEALLPAQALRTAWGGGFDRAFELIAATLEHQAESDRRAYRAAEIALYALAAGLQSEASEALRVAGEALAQCEPSSRRTIRTRIWLALAELQRGHPAAAHRHLQEAERALLPAMRRLRTLTECVRALYRLRMEQCDESDFAGSLERLRSEHFGGIARLISALNFPQSKGHGYALLTAAERTILDLVAQGASTKEVAERTRRSPQTVDTHIRSICRKLSCSGRREAVALAMNSGWIQT
ncbi:MAG: hypothetical protein DLM50_08340 [Candidatus Meridianibacter frigidus]|nr:MAG: hypothetical protein DLM50_08340 [Candidatus Eremiobacteraeota bacterium]